MIKYTKGGIKVIIHAIIGFLIIIFIIGLDSSSLSGYFFKPLKVILSANNENIVENIIKIMFIIILIINIKFILPSILIFKLKYKKK